MKKKCVKIFAILLIVLGVVWMGYNLLRGAYLAYIWTEDAEPITIELNMLADGIHNTPDKSGIVFDALPGFTFPTNTIIKLYQKTNSRKRKGNNENLRFAFFVPAGWDVALPPEKPRETNSVHFTEYESIAAEDISSEGRMNILRDVIYHYPQGWSKYALNRIPKLDVYDIEEYFFGYNVFVNERGIFFYIVKTDDGAYFFGIASRTKYDNEPTEGAAVKTSSRQPLSEVK